MSLDRNTAIARAAYEAEQSYHAATDGLDKVEWGSASQLDQEMERIRVIGYFQGVEGDRTDPGWLVWVKVVEIMRQALE